MTKLLSGKVALVTGGSFGIGAATARMLAQQGANIAIGYVCNRQAAKEMIAELQALKVEAKSFEADPADTLQVNAMVQTAAAHFGRLDILVNAASIAVCGQVDNPDADIHGIKRQHAVNFCATSSTIRTAAPLMRDGGRIITLGSCLCAHAGTSGLADFTATQAAMVGYTKGAARDLGPRNITVNVVQSGFVDDELMDPLAKYPTPYKTAVPLGRPALAEEVAAAITFLASPAASYITGTVLTVDGGYSA
ncbi:SDR family NAD(P)-dependent oxidoreductase [Thalassospira sp. TSL5-1]|uniref:SDR family NAD(P)-dependent oxidoreductase n=1 Tax=Thalassospira sp. TSL5-1 TaxID=1544451 RepID=UPI000938F6C9|nr:SDR family oxidoreductase [Thalassospira sp. TSL5-1]OKH89701.1 hypothetical protein LF95_07200 [Thalassospira sp. TSL5-1]